MGKRLTPVGEACSTGSPDGLECSDAGALGASTYEAL